MALFKGALPTSLLEVTQANVDWYKAWSHGEKLKIGDRRSWDGILYEVYNLAGDNLYPPDQVPSVFKKVYQEK